MAETEAELVITAPPDVGAMLAYATKSRMTLGVLVELIANSRKEVVLAAPFVQIGASNAADPIAYAIDAALERGVCVDIVSTGVGLRGIKKDRPKWCKHNNVRLYRPAQNIANDQMLGSHAKFCIADRSAAYVGSANLTGPGLSVHFEMGVLLKGAVALQIAEFWEYAVRVNMFVLSQARSLLR